VKKSRLQDAWFSKIDFFWRILMRTSAGFCGGVKSKLGEKEIMRNEVHVMGNITETFFVLSETRVWF